MTRGKTYFSDAFTSFRNKIKTNRKFIERKKNVFIYTEKVIVEEIS